jgi:hypothetical protein
MKQYLLSLSFILGSLITSAQSLTFNLNLTPAQLVNGNLLGPGISATNIAGSIHPGASGAFSGGAGTGVGLNSGIALSTGILATVNNQPSTFNSSNNNYPGDALLTSLVNNITYDAQVLEFDFKAASDSVEFNFVFASEEYNEFVNTPFNDVFAFFVSGPGYAPNTNVALIPGTQTPVAINNVNNGGPYSGVSSGPCVNCNYYVDNVNGPVQISYDGLTTVIQIKFAVWPCSDYHFKIAIADVADGVYDSAVLIEQNSFVACPLIQINHLGLPAPQFMTVCAGGSLTLTAPPGPNYLWNTGDTTQSITITQPGNYEVMYIESPCFAFSQQINVVQQGSIQTPVISQAGNLLIETGIVPSPQITYQWYFNGGIIPGATNSTVNLQGDGCYRLIIYEGTCESASNIICINTTSVSEVFTNSFSVMPHPVGKQSIIKNPFNNGQEFSLRLFELTGKLVWENTSSNEVILSNDFLPAGMLLVELSNSAGEFIRGKVVVGR